MNDSIKMVGRAINYASVTYDGIFNFANIDGSSFAHLLGCLVTDNSPFAGEIKSRLANTDHGSVLIIIFSDKSILWCINPKDSHAVIYGEADSFDEAAEEWATITTDRPNSQEAMALNAMIEEGW